MPAIVSISLTATIALLFGFVFVFYGGNYDAKLINADKYLHEASQIQSAITLYEINNSAPPASMAELVNSNSLSKAIPGWHIDSAGQPAVIQISYLPICVDFNTGEGSSEKEVPLCSEEVISSAKPICCHFVDEDSEDPPAAQPAVNAPTKADVYYLVVPNK